MPNLTPYYGLPGNATITGAPTALFGAPNTPVQPFTNPQQGAIGAFNAASMWGTSVWTPPVNADGTPPPNPNGPRDEALESPETQDPVEVTATPEPDPVFGSDAPPITGSGALSTVLWIAGAAGVLLFLRARAKRKGRAA